MNNKQVITSKYKYGFHKPEFSVFKTPRGLSREVVEAISHFKNEPDWMRQFRLNSLMTFEQKMMPSWGADLSGIDFDNLFYYISPSEEKFHDWADVPQDIKDTYDKIGIPQAERKFLAGVGAQYDSEVIYHNLKKKWEDLGVIFVDTDTAVQKYPDLVRQYFGTIIPAADNKFAALNSAVWSGGSFVYVPAGVHVTIPLQAYFRINAANMGQFERTLIIAEEGSYVSYIEGCTAPTYTTNSLHSAVVEIVVKKGARVRYTTIQNWSHNVYNLVTKRMLIEEEGFGEWVDGNIGCLQSGSTITTPNGIKAIENIQIGEKVLSYDEKRQSLCFKKVVNKKFSGLRRVHKISVDQRVIYATSNHPFYSYIYEKDKPKKIKRYKLDYVRADTIKKVILPNASLDYGKSHKLLQPSTATNFITRNQYSLNLNVIRKKKIVCRFPKETTTDMMWLFGLFIGDGSFDKKYGTNENIVRWAKLQFSVPTSDRAYQKLIKIMQNIAPEMTVSLRKDKILSSWASVSLVEFFELNGFKTGCLKKTIPEWIFSLPEEQRLAFIAGYLDSDGTLTLQRRKFSIKSVNKNLIESSAKLLTTLGIFCSINKEEEKEVKIFNYKSISKVAYRLDFTLDIRLLPYVSTHTQEKYALLTASKKKYFKKVGRSNICLPEFLEVKNVNVSNLSEIHVPTWDIEVEDTANFVSEGFIVHNSKVTMKYPSVILAGKGAKGEVLSLAFAGKGQHQDTGGKAIHLAPYTTSTITAKSVSMSGGRSSYRGMVKIINGAKGSKSFVRCDALLLDELSRSDTYPTNIVNEEDVTLGHEASVSKIGEQQLFYLMSRGLSEAQSTSLVVNGFIEPIVKELPLEYAVELNRLINLSMEGSVG